MQSIFEYLNEACRAKMYYTVVTLWNIVISQDSIKMSRILNIDINEPFALGSEDLRNRPLLIINVDRV